MSRSSAARPLASSAWSIKGYLVALVAAVAVPLIGVLGYSIYVAARADARAAGTHVLGLAEVAAAHIEGVLLRTQDLTRNLSQRPWVAALDRAGCAANLEELSLTLPDYVNLAIVDRQGAILCAAHGDPKLARASVDAADWFGAVRRANEARLSAPVIDPLSGRWVSLYAHPIRDARGSFIGAVVLGIELNYLGREIRQTELPPNSTIRISDARGVILALYPARAQWLGRSARGVEITERALREQKGSGEARGLDGVRRVYGYATVAAAGWNVIVGVPADWVYAPGGAQAREAAWLAVFVLAAAGLGAWWVGRRIARPCGLFLANVRALGRGDYRPMHALEGPAELRTLMTAFDAMAQARKRAESDLRESRESFRGLTEHAAVAIFRGDARGSITYVNPRMCEMLGRNAEQLLGEGWRQALHPLDSERVTQAWAATVTRGYGKQLEFRFVRPDGTVVHVVGEAHTEKRDGGAPHGLVGTITDVTRERVQAQRIRQWETIFRHAGWAILMADAETNHVVTANAAACAMYGYSLQQLQGKDLADLFAPEARAELAAHARAVAERGHHSYESVHERNQGTRFPVAVDVVSFVDETDGQRYRVANVQDISERVRAAQALRESELRMRLAVNATQEAIVDRNFVTGESFYSDRYKTMLGYAPDELALDHDTWVSLLHPEDRARVLKQLRRSIEVREPYNIVYRLRAKDGSYRWVHVRAQSVRDEQGRALRAVAAVEDITERMRVQEELRTARDRAKTLAEQLIRAQETERRQIARELHDQLGQELTAIKLSIAASARNGTSAPEQVAALNKQIDQAIARVRGLSLLLRPPQLDHFGLVAALTWLLDNNVRPSGLRVIFDSAPGFPRLPVEIETACFRIAQESLTNVLRHAHAAQVRITLTCGGGEVRLAVADDGIGFDPEAVRERALAGLSIGVLGMEERASLVGGRLTVISAPGCGTEVVVAIALPAQISAAHTPEPSPEPAEPR